MATLALQPTAAATLPAAQEEPKYVSASLSDPSRFEVDLGMEFVDPFLITL
jgi:hypothetical protein